jgi:ABC-2 type transport system permease protein
MQFVILIAATVIARSVPFTPELIYLLPAVLVLLVYGMALGLLFAALNVYLRDIQYLVEVVLLLMLWASPIVYSWEMVKNAVGTSLLLDVYTDNPVTLSVLGFQRAMWVAGHDAVAYPDNLMLRTAVAFVIGLLLLVFSQRVFSRLQGNFAQEI